LIHALPKARLEVVLPGDALEAPAIGHPEFTLTTEALAELALLPGNAVRVLSNGDETFPPLLADLRSATRSITIQMYYGKPGAVVDTVLRILAERARAGVQVLFMYDAIGSDHLPASYRRELQQAGVRVAIFRPIQWHELDMLGRRAHTRVVVIDGLIGYTGGFGLDDKWLGDARRPGQWRETNVRFTGPAVARLQAAFVEEWAEATGELLLGGRLFPAATVASGAHTAGVMHSLPGGGPSPAERALAVTIAGARRTLYISNAYFLPNASFRRLLAAAARRGVDVRVLTNGSETDNSLTALAARARYEELLAAGVRIFEYQPTMMHAKTLVADGRWSGIGSMNFDNRSLALNSETTLFVLDGGIGATMDSVFLEDLRRAEEVTLEASRSRPWIERVLQRSASLITRVL
ncbi:MAG TPA: phospholipase D-like domain-containing protein, partial [Gemmatimonadales bacterium]|nr:phospholipase D-like domain-containing protein [Gemmatimonadales bacterium]